MKQQIVIQQINNGWLVITPDPNFKPKGPQDQHQPVQQACADYNDVCEYLKKFFPVEAISA